MITQIKRNKYYAILKEELVPALGCTEPIAIAFASARARKLLGVCPDRIEVLCSGNIIKNAKSVTVPNSGGLKGISTSAILGAIGGNSDIYLEVLSTVTEAHRIKCRALLDVADYCSVRLLNEGINLHLRITVSNKDHKAIVEIANEHSNIIYEELDGEVLFKKDLETNFSKDRIFMNVQDILTFAEEMDINLVKDILDPQIECNTRIAKEGLTNDYGAQVGKTLLAVYGNDIKTRAKAIAAAGSDARMSGCVLPVIINSGSGNQGMTVSLPVIEYAKELNVSQETLYRALVISNLIAIHQKTTLGRLSAYCGAVSAACGSASAITYLYGGDYDAITRTITNTLANVSGIVCDGAKPSCAAKIASAIDAGLMGHFMSINNNSFLSGDGLVKKNVEKTIESFGKMGRDGMKATDIEILKIMIEDN